MDIHFLKKLFCHLLPVLLSVSLAGCASPPRPVHPLGGGYQEVVHPSKSPDSPDDMRISLEYRAPDGKITPVWPSLSGVPEIIKGGMAIFVGDKAYVSSDPDDPRGERPRLFAVQSPGLPLDITDEVLLEWSRQSGKDFSNAERLLEMVTPVENGDKLEIQLEFWESANGWPDNATVGLTWNQVLDIMRTVKGEGVEHKDLRWHTPYVEN